MKPTEHNTKTPSTAIGLLALLCALLRVKGSGAPKTDRRSATPKTGRRIDAPKTSLRLILSVFATSLGALAFASAPAQAAGGHVFKESFKGTPGHELSDPTGVAVNNATGNVYVVDKGSSRVEEFNPEGTKVIAEFGTSGELTEPEAIAIDNSGEEASRDPSAGDVYVTDHNVVDKFTAEGEYKGQITGTCEKVGEVPSPSCKAFAEFESFEGIAVDPKGQVWIYQDGGQIDAFSDAASNAFLSSRESEVGKPKPGLAVDSEDNLYVAHGEHYIAKLNSLGKALQTPEDEGSTGVAVEASSNDVYVDSGNPEEPGVPPEIQVYTPSETAPGGFKAGGAPAETFGATQLADRGGTALAVSYANVSRGDVYVVDSATGEVDIFSPPKPLVVTGEHTFGASFGGPGSGPGELSEPSGVAVEEQFGDMYVADKGNNRVERFGSNGEYLGQFNGSGSYEVVEKGISKVETDLLTPPSPLSSPEGIAVDNDPVSPSYGDVYVVDAGHAVVDKFTSTGEYVGQITTGAGGASFAGLNGVAVDSNGTVWVFQAVGTDRGDVRGPIDDYSNGLINEFKESRIVQAVSQNGYAFGIPGLAVDSEDNLYVAHSVGDEKGANQVAKLNSKGEVLTPPGEAIGGGEDAITGLAVEVSSNDVYIDNGTTVGRYSPSGEEIESLGSETLKQGSGVGVSSVSGDVYVADAAADVIDVFPPARGPEIKEQQVTQVGATEATLDARINPDGFATTYHFEYDTSPYISGVAHGASLPVPNVAIGSGESPVRVSVSVAGLHPGTVYYYRVVAESAPLGAPQAFYGPNNTFTTPSGSEPPQSCPNEQLRAEQPFGLALPDCRAYEMVSPEETGGQDAVDSFETTNARAAESSANPAITYASKGSFGSPTGAAGTDQFVSRRNAANDRWETQAVTPLWNPDSTITYSSFDATAFTPELEAGIALTDAALPSSGAPTSLGGGFGLYVSDFATGSYQYVGVAEGVPDGASTDLSHVVFGGGAVSEWVDGQVVPVSVTNEGAAIQVTVGSQNSSGTSLDNDVWHAVSSSGSRVYFSSPPGRYEGAPVLYLRENAGVGAEQGLSIEQEQSKLNAKKECTESAKACTVEVDAAEEGAPGPSGGGRYWGASAEGERVFFTDENKLTKDSTAVAGDPDLYEYQIEPGHLYGHLVDLTSESIVAKAGEHAGVRGVVQISEDGSYVYFVAKGVLTGEEENQHHEKAKSEADNLYVSHEGGAPTFIATLETADESDWNKGDSAADYAQGGPEVNTAVVNPGGTRLAFLSTKKLTGYDNHDANTGNPDAEIFLYEAGPGGLVCASCDPTGARPPGPSSFVARTAESFAQYRPRNLLEDGTLFFDSADALVPHASDGRLNVYEYEHGSIHAISNVAGGDESFFLDASPSGEDVFFGSSNKLLPQDTGDNAVVWDARQDGGFPFPTAAPPCTTAEACRAASPPTPSVFGTPPSATFAGPGNVATPPPAVVKPKPKSLTRAQKLAAALKVCERDKKKAKRVACEKQAKKKYKVAKKSAKRATNDRRAPR